MFDARRIVCVHVRPPRVGRSMGDVVVVESLPVKRAMWRKWLSLRWVVQDEEDQGLFHVTPLFERVDWPHTEEGETT